MSETTTTDSGAPSGSSDSLLGTPDGGGQQAPPSGQQQPPASAPAWVGDDGSFSEGWLDRLPEDLKDARADVAKYKSLPDVIKALHHSHKLLGKKSQAVTVPGENATPEEVSEFRKALGIPESLEEYQIKPDQLPEGMDWNDEIAKPYAELAMKHNIPPAAMKELVSLHAAQEAQKMQLMGEQFAQTKDQAIAKLKTDWGSNFDKNLAKAKAAASLAGADPTSSGFADPAVVQAFVRLADMISDDKLMGAANGASAMPGKVRADDIVKNASNPMHQRYWDGDQEVVRMVQDLYRNG